MKLADCNILAKAALHSSYASAVGPVLGPKQDVRLAQDHHVFNDDSARENFGAEHEQGQPTSTAPAVDLNQHLRQRRPCPIPRKE